MTETWIVALADDQCRLDRFLAAQRPDLSRRAVVRLIGHDAVQVIRSGQLLPRPHKGDRLIAGDEVRLLLTRDALARAQPEHAIPTPCEVEGVVLLHADAHLVVVNKPPGRPSHPLQPGERDTVANHMVHLHPECAQSGGPAREAGLVQRLDTLASGVLVAARTPEAYRLLRAKFSEHRVVKRYQVLLTGTPPETGEIDRQILSRAGRRRVVVGEGQPALTTFRLLRRLGPVSLVEAQSRTGRRHQIRAHLASIGHPLASDPLYSTETTDIVPEPLLHASRLELIHPGTGTDVVYTAPLHPHQAELLRRLENSAKT